MKEEEKNVFVRARERDEGSKFLILYLYISRLLLRQVMSASSVVTRDVSSSSSSFSVSARLLLSVF